LIELDGTDMRRGLEGIVSKRRDSPYSSGRSRHWIKSKNPNAPAVNGAAGARSAIFLSDISHSRQTHPVAARIFGM
jgi:hypothetical protein